MEEQQDLIVAAMEIITHAGDARNFAKQARAALRSMDDELVKELMQSAKDEIAIAHRSQTAIIQDEARGIRYEYSMLFNHAQDTLMTINSEIELTQDMIDTFQFLFDQLAIKEKAHV